jgi:hypothetical protein
MVSSLFTRLYLLDVQVKKVRRAPPQQSVNNEGSSDTTSHTSDSLLPLEELVAKAESCIDKLKLEKAI